MIVEAQQADEYAPWIGRSRKIYDDITAFPVKALAGTLGRENMNAVAATPVPPLWHWLYFLPVYGPSETRCDGHAKGDEFMPPIAMPRRIWAGSKFVWNTNNPLSVGDRAARVSRIDSITPKSGQSGQLVFVKTVHEFHNGAGLSLLNVHQSAFRGEAKEQGAASQPIVADTDAAWHRELVPDAVLLFRFSALMFNSHRIHYDSPYATGEECYPALLVQGPLIATLLMDLLSRSSPNAVVLSLELKAVRPSFVDRCMHLRGRPEGTKVHLWAADDEGRLTMTALAEIEP